MLITVCRGKLNRIAVTHKSVAYHGSITVDAEILELLGVVPNEKVLVVNLDTGGRFETYVEAGKFGSRCCILNGGAAYQGEVGQDIGFITFGQLELEEAAEFVPKVIEVKPGGKIVRLKGF